MLEQALEDGEADTPVGAGHQAYLILDVERLGLLGHCVRFLLATVAIPLRLRKVVRHCCDNATLVRQVAGGLREARASPAASAAAAAACTLRFEKIHQKYM